MSTGRPLLVAGIIVVVGGLMTVLESMRLENAAWDCVLAGMVATFLMVVIPR